MSVRYDLAPRLSSRAAERNVSSPSMGASGYPKTSPFRPRAAISRRLPQGAFSLRRQGALISCRIAGEPKTALRGVNLRCNYTRQPRGSLNANAGGSAKADIGTTLQASSMLLFFSSMGRGKFSLDSRRFRCP